MTATRRYDSFRRIIRRISALTLTLALALSCVCVQAASTDVVRYVQRDASGEFVPISIEGAVLFEQCDCDKIVVQTRTQDGTDTITIPSENVLWIQFDSAPMEMGTARVEIEVGNYAEALEKLDDIDEKNLETMVAQELEWYRAYAKTELARAKAGKIADGGRAFDAFVKKNQNHYRYYDALYYLGDTLMAVNQPKLASAKFEQLAQAQSPNYRARGDLGLARLAILEQDDEKARQLLEPLVADETLDEKLEGLDVRVAAQIELATVFANQNDVEQALQTLRDALNSTANTAVLQQARIYLALGRIAANAERDEEAILAYLHVDLLYPTARAERVAALQALVPLWRKVGREERARETSERLRTRFNVKTDN
ncbi:MAG: hypothetical protein Q4G03_12055 [Planctomycetia bacterium]|nr:hypothetical protein [Planctomycetia bacterium]